MKAITRATVIRLAFVFGIFGGILGGGAYLQQSDAALHAGSSAATSISSAAYPLLAPDGTAGAPSYSFSGNPDTGMYQGSGVIAWAYDGAFRATLNATSFALFGDNAGGFLNLLNSTVIKYSADGVPGNGDASLSRVAAGVIGVGTGAAASVAGTIAATNYRIAAVPVILGTAPTLASGGCTTPSAVTSNGTAAFSVNVGTGCSGSQPLVFTLPAATTGWQCNARNSSNAATSVASHSNAVSTTNVTITNYARTTGVAAAWTDADVVVVSCMGY